MMLLRWIVNKKINQVIKINRHWNLIKITLQWGQIFIKNFPKMINKYMIHINKVIRDTDKNKIKLNINFKYQKNINLISNQYNIKIKVYKLVDYLLIK